jgi:hypothetical protein
VGPGFSPLDEELALLPGELSPSVEHGLARLCAVLPFAQAAEYLAFFWGVQLSISTARRHAEAAGAAYVTIQTAEVERLERDAPTPPAGPAVQQLSADGAMVPLVGGTWAEVRTVALGTIAAERRPGGGAHATELSYFSRLADHATFTRLAHVELHWRGTETAGVVVGVMDGAPWLQKLLDRYRPDAVRVLDFPHALEYLAEAARVSFGVGTAATEAWIAARADELKHGAPTAVLAALLELPPTTARDKAFGYLEQRLDQLRYADFLALGYPIGSGLVESANKLVVEVRLKGSGMHWLRANVDPMLALRNIVCNQRWAEAWPRICGQLRAQDQAQRAARRQARLLAKAAGPVPTEPAPALAPPAPPTPRPQRPPRVLNGRPTADHPWRRPFLTNARVTLAS